MSGQYSAGLSIEEIKKRSGLKRVIKLASNENNYGLPLGLKLFLWKEIPQLYRYPDNSYTPLKTSMAAHFGLKEENILLGNGSDELLFNLINYWSGPDQEILIPRPSFQMYSIIPKNNSKRFIEIAMPDFEYDLTAFQKRISRKSSMVILCNPNNPTGTYIKADALVAFLKKVPSRVMVIIDEAYHHFADALDFPDSIAYLKKFKNLVILRTFSKFFSLAGLRLGYGFADASIVKRYYSLKIPFSINRLSENIGAFVFSHYADFVRTGAKIIREKEYFYKKLTALGVPFKQTQGNFIFLYDLPDSKSIFASLLAKGIIIREMEGFGLKNCLRITIGRPSENRAFIKALAKALGISHVQSTKK